MTTQAGIQPAKMRRMAKPPMVQKTYRVPKSLYELAMEKAAENEENLSDVIREALEKVAGGRVRGPVCLRCEQVLRPHDVLG